MSIRVDIEKNFGSFRLETAFEAENEVLALLGASGCGKSMTLKCIAGIVKPDRGHIEVDGVTLFDSEKHINLTPQERMTGLMFQNYALFPNMTVLGNLRAGARREKNKALREKNVADMMEMFGLNELKNRLPAQLSGGQQQRVALARILVSSPRILMLDEPFSALDSHLRFRLEQEVREVIRRFRKTVLLVSHDRDEVFRLSDSIAVMNGGRIEAYGGKHEVFRNPRTRQAAVLTGCKNISRASALGDGRVLAEDWGVALSLPQGAQAKPCIGTRMHDICAGDGVNAVDCAVVSEIENPFSITVMLRPVDRPQAVPVGWEMPKEEWARLRAERIRVCFPPENLLTLEE